jgi:nucleoside-diphosphate-sugar epimerase
MTRILVTGANGLIGNLVYGHLARQPLSYNVLGLDHSPEPSPRIYPDDVTPIPPERLLLADLADFNAVLAAVQGVQQVVHMAAEPGGNDWERIQPNNLAGAYNVFEACRQAGVQRLVFASSVMVHFGHFSEEPFKAIREGRFDQVPDDFQRLDRSDRPRPTTLYAASKVWAEALGSYYAEVHGLSCLCIRIGWVVAENRPRPNYGRSAWCSHRDICQLVQRCLEAPPDLKFDIFYGFSNNRYAFADLEHTRRVLGYSPEDSADNYE